jgi:hypothetical protein
MVVAGEGRHARDSARIRRSTPVALSKLSAYEGPCASCGAEVQPHPTRPDVYIRRHRATEPVPSDTTIEDWIFDVSLPEATDGCTCDPDGYCEHGHASWLLRLGLI